MVAASPAEPVPNRLGLLLNVGCCQVASAAPARWVWQGMGKVAAPKPTALTGFITTSQRPRYLEIRAVMEQIPEIQKDSLDQFDCKLLNPSLQKVADKRRKDQFKRLIAGCIGVGRAPSLVLPATLAVFLDRVYGHARTGCVADHRGEMIFTTTRALH